MFIHFHKVQHNYVFFHDIYFLFGYIPIIFDIASLSLVFNTSIEVPLYIVTHVIMITTIYLCHHHQLHLKLIQQSIIQLTKRQSKIFYKICCLQKIKNIQYK